LLDGGDPNYINYQNNIGDMLSERTTKKLTRLTLLTSCKAGVILEQKP